MVIPKPGLSREASRRSKTLKRGAEQGPGTDNPGPSGPALAFKNFTFTYRSQSEPTLFDINLTIRRGEKILILGQSGSGKSTLIHCINGLIPHAFKGKSSGECCIMGKPSSGFDIFGISKIAGTVLQDTDGQFVGLSAAEDIAFAGENDCLPQDRMREQVLAAAMQVEIADHLGKSPHDLSGGQKQRVSVAGVLVDDVEILLFDEPLANLDPASGRDMVELIDRLHKETGKTIIIVEHRLEDVLYRPVDRIIVMDQGRIIADQKPDDLLASTLLGRTGLREPLYISALRYAGVPLSPAMKLQSIEALHVDYGPLCVWDRELAFADDRSRKIPAGMPLLEARELRFRYEEKGEDVLRGISFSIYKGECAALVGKNGSGKSTLAKCVCGFVKPDGGKLFFEGGDLEGASIMERAEKIGYVMQNPNQMISFPMIYDEAALGLRTRNMGEAEVKERVHEALRICGLYPFRNWPVGALSYGQKKRLTIASILVLQPSFLILDEPTAGQDYRHYSEFMEFLLRLNRDEHITLLLVTHDMHLMLEYTSRALVLSGGNLVCTKAPFEVLTDDAVIERANLKQTSLYGLALAAALPDPRAFVGRYIAYERKHRVPAAEQAGEGHP